MKRKASLSSLREDRMLMRSISSWRSPDASGAQTTMRRGVAHAGQRQTFGMELSMKAARLNRLFHAKSRRCFDVAIDHGFFNEYNFLAGIENIEKAVAAVVAAGPDAIQLTVGQAPILQAIPKRPKPALVLRTDVANV